MSDLNGSVAGLASKNHSAIVRAMATVTQKRVAELIGVSESVLSEFKGSHLERAAAVVAACGLRVVPCTNQSFDADYIDALKVLAKIGLGAQAHITGEDA